jgi:hypothetical protein
MPSLDRILQLLETLKKQKDSFLYPLEVPTLETYLAGVRAGCAAFGAEIPKDLRRKVTEARGWKRTAAGPVAQMKEKGMDDEAVMDELIAIEMELFRQLAAQKSG